MKQKLDKDPKNPGVNSITTPPYKGNCVGFAEAPNSRENRRMTNGNDR
jgi:hypothetical protein